MADNPSPQTPNTKRDQMVAAVSVGLMIGLINVIVEISFGALVFSGDLADYIPVGIGLLLFGAFAAQLVVSLTSSFKGMVTVSQDAPAALLGIELAVIGTSMAAGTSADAMFFTAVAAIALTSLLTGVVFLLLGRFNLGVLVRYLPYPVIAGFLAGTGWFLFKGGFDIAADASLSLSTLGQLMSGELVVRWLPAVLIGIFFFWAMGRFSQFWVLPAAVFAVMVIFYSVIFFSGSSVAQFQQTGWFLGPFPKGQLWRPVMLEAVPQADWGWVLSHLPTFSAVVVVSVLSMLLNVSGIELMVGRDLELNKELKSAGASNMVGALLGTIVTYPTLSLTTLGQRSGKPSRLVGLASAAVLLVMLFLGTALLAFVPKPVVGGILVFIGIDFLYTWLVRTYARLSKIEYAIIWIILITMSVVGVLEGVGLGLLLALGLFVFSYSRTKVIKHTLTDDNYRSNVDRSHHHNRVLKEHHEWLYILELQGFIFFGTAHHLYTAIKARLEAGDKALPEYIVLDFRQVVGIDASAIQSFQRTLQLAAQKQTIIIFSSLDQTLSAQLKKDVLTRENATIWRTFQDLDYAAEWCEEQKIEAHLSRDEHEHLTMDAKYPACIVDFLSVDEAVDADARKDILARLAGYLEEMEIPAGTVLIEQGEPTRGLFFIEEGITTAEITDYSGNVKRLRKMQPGTVVGEIGLYASVPASASVVAQEDCRVLFLSRQNLRQMEQKELEVAAEMHRFIAQLLSYRITTATHTIQALLD